MANNLEQSEEARHAIEIRTDLFATMRDQATDALDSLRMFLQAHESESNVSGEPVPSWVDDRKRVRASIVRAMESISAALVHVESVVQKKSK